MIRAKRWPQRAPVTGIFLVTEPLWYGVSKSLDFGGIVIGIFDSGIGGLTVLKSLRRHFPEHSFLYLGDTARLPYGSKSSATIRSYLEQNMRFLIAAGVDAIVVACNSASSVLQENTFQTIPVYGVIEPGALCAIAQTQNHRIGVIGTRATIGTQAYVKAIHRLQPAVEVFSQACPLLVPLVEEGWIDDPLTNLVVYRYLQPLIQSQIDTLILGCTHYPILRAAIGKVVGPAVTLVDSAQAIAEQMQHDIQSGRLQSAVCKGSAQATIRFCVTDNSTSFQMVAEMILQERIAQLEWVNV
jgi:glutamate racemase